MLAQVDDVAALTLVTLATLQLVTGQQGSGQRADFLPSQPSKCDDFVLGTGYADGHYTFQTPNYPGKYPNMTDCVKVIQARETEIIRVDFRDLFFIETSSAKCSYDFLEIRDGPYGFSPPIRGTSGRFCGKKPPQGKELTSRGRYLWLRFHADESIEHNGFRGVFDLVPGPSRSTQPDCRIERRVSRGQLVFTEKDFKDKISGGILDCSLDIIVPEGQQLHVNFDSLLFPSDGDCDVNFVELYDGFTVQKSHYYIQMCVAKEKKALTTRTNRVVLRAYGIKQERPPAFVMVATVLHKAPCLNLREYFDCGGFCISRDPVDRSDGSDTLVCNGHPNCPNGNDEQNCANSFPGGGHGHGSESEEKVKITVKKSDDGDSDDEKGIDYHSIILGVIGGLLFIFVAICIFITIRQRTIENRNRKRKEAEQKREIDPTADLEAVGGTVLEMNQLLRDGSLLTHTVPINNHHHGHHGSTKNGPLNGSVSRASPGPAPPPLDLSAPNTPSLRRMQMQDSAVGTAPDPLRASLPRVGRYLAAGASLSMDSGDGHGLDSPIEPIASRTGSSPYLHHKSARPPQPQYYDDSDDAEDYPPPPPITSSSSSSRSQPPTHQTHQHDGSYHCRIHGPVQQQQFNAESRKSRL